MFPDKGMMLNWVLRHKESFACLFGVEAEIISPLGNMQGLFREVPNLLFSWMNLHECGELSLRKWSCRSQWGHIIHIMFLHELHSESRRGALEGLTEQGFSALPHTDNFYMLLCSRTVFFRLLCPCISKWILKTSTSFKYLNWHITFKCRQM